MAKNENKTIPTAASVEEFLDAVEDERKRDDSYQIMAIMEGLTKSKAQMWGPSIIGFGKYHYKYDSGREGDMPLAGFSPRKNAIVLYLGTGFAERDALLEKLGKHKVSKGCIYIKKLEDVSIPTLKKMIDQSIKYIKSKYK